MPLPPLAKKNKTKRNEKQINKNEMDDSQRRSLEVYRRPVDLSVCSCLGLSRLNPMPLPPFPPLAKKNKTKQNEKQINKNEMDDSQRRSLEVYRRPLDLSVCSCLGLSRLNPMPLPPFPPLAKKNKTKQNEKQINKNEMDDSQRRSLEVYRRPVDLSVCSCLGLSRLNPMPLPPFPPLAKKNKTKQNEKQINKNEMDDSQRRSLEVYRRPLDLSVCSCLGLSRLNPVQLRIPPPESCSKSFPLRWRGC